MILLTSDFLGEKYQTFHYHAEGILELLKSTLSCAGIEDTFIYASKKDYRNLNFNPTIFFALSNLNYTDSLPPLVKYSDLSCDSIAYFNEFIMHFKLVIGYELTDLTVTLLEKLNVKYINIWLHPVRFMDDELFLISSNCKKIQEKLCKYVISEDSFFVNAKYAQIMINRRHKIVLKPQSCVFFGQTANDKTLRNSQGFISISDYKDNIAYLASIYPQLYYSQHPLRKDDSEFLLLKKYFKDIQKLSANSYQIISNPNVALVTTISSSIGIEAYYFGKNVIFLNKPTVDIKKPNTFSIDSSIFNPCVFADILSIKKENSGNFIFLSKNKLRNILDSYYAYPILKDHYDGN